MARDLGVLVVAALALAGGPAALAQQVDPAQLQIVEGRATVTESGFVRIAGELRNNSGQWVIQPRIVVELRDAHGRKLQSQSVATAVSEDQGWGSEEFVYPERTWIAPGETAVFEFFRDKAKLGGEYGGHKLTVASAHRAENPPRMALVGFTTSRDGETVVARGTLKNTGSVACYSAKAVLGLYDPAGKLLRSESETPEAAFQKLLAPGQSVAFQARLSTDDTGPVGDVKAWADCGEK